VDGVRGPRVAVSGLAHAAGVYHHADVRVQVDPLAVSEAKELASFERGSVFDDEHRDVRVPHEPEVGLLEREVAESRFGVVEVFPDGPAKRAVDECEVV
jgi:hypothetical protein